MLPAGHTQGNRPDASAPLPRYHRPAGGRLGDPIPFLWDGTWHVFYLDYRPEFFNHTPPGARQTAWAHVTSTDLVHWHRHPDAIAPGPEGAVDSGSCATGSVFEHDGVFHLFYTGRSFTTRGQRRETICHATSANLVSWAKDPANPVARPDAERYALEHWRDPFVYWQPQAQEFWMAITAARREGPPGRTGCMAVLASRDLQTWQPRDPLWSPALAPTHECPDVFRWGDWWYLVVSHGGRTVYRMARDPAGQWVAPAVDTFDDHFYYAAKTAGDERRRVLFGWLAVKAGGHDAGPREWGGNLVARELVQRPDGTLWPSCPPEYVLPDARAHPPAPVARIGDWRAAGNGLQHPWTAGFASSALDVGTADCQIRTLIDWQPGTKAFGLFLRAHAGPARGYALRLEPGAGTVTFGQLTEAGRIVEELRRPAPDLASLAGGCPCVVTLTGTVVDIFVGDRVALAARCHDFRGTQTGLFVEEGAAAFRDLALVPLAH